MVESPSMNERIHDALKIPEDGIFQIGDNLTVNIYSGDLKNDLTDQSANLAKKELGFFLLLASHQDEAVNYEKIIKEVWDDNDIHVFEKSDKERIWMVVSRLKNKLDGLDSDFIINTIPNIGYSLSPKPTNNTTK